MATNPDNGDDPIIAALPPAGTEGMARDERLRLVEQRRAFEDMIGLGWDGDLDASRKS